MPPIKETSTVDVLIVGAGPTGLFTALCLTRLGIDVRVIEQRIFGEAAGQADGIQSRTVEMWDSLGTGDKLRQFGKIVYQMATYDPNEQKTGIKAASKVLNVPLASARYQYELTLQAKHIEEIIRDALSEVNVHVEQPCVLSKLESLVEADYPIKASVVQCVHFDTEKLAASKFPSYAREKAASDKYLVDYVEIIRARYLIGCDGARSWVRQQCGIVMEGTIPGLTYGVIDFTPVTNFPTCHAKSLIQSPLAGMLGYIPKPNGTARLYTLLRDTVLIEALDKGSEEERARKLSQIVSNGFAPYDMRVEDITWCTTYKVTQRVASRYSHNGCIFIAGDACHTHSANAGQGANVSMADAYNLSWKLAHVIRGWASKSILDTYELERRPCSLELIEFDKDIQDILSPDSYDPEDYAKLWHRQLLFVTGLGLQYKSSLIIPEHFQDIMAGVTIGRRFPPAEIIRYLDWVPCNTLDIIGYTMKFKLLVFAGDTTQPSVMTLRADFIEELGKIPRFREIVEISVILGVKKEASATGYPHNKGSILTLFSVFIDDGINSEQQPGLVHKAFKISPDVGAAVLVRPDGHVAMVFPPSIDQVHLLNNYLSTL
ncbi:FAD binding domain-containing protein [Collybia nuda]|uniref:FAD binding domain-containing protein n=1 Tax=Collybia nuda TaxID=64659 RepID=A0A9P5Y6M8_9AGAR|nr:FAD binding domain-containing protein [Collybia nuda]